MSSAGLTALNSNTVTKITFHQLAFLLYSHRTVLKPGMLGLGLGLGLGLALRPENGGLGLGLGLGSLGLGLGLGLDS